MKLLSTTAILLQLSHEGVSTLQNALQTNTQVAPVDENNFIDWFSTRAGNKNEENSFIDWFTLRSGNKNEQDYFEKLVTKILKTRTITLDTCDQPLAMSPVNPQNGANCVKPAPPESDNNWMLVVPCDVDDEEQYWAFDSEDSLTVRSTSWTSGNGRPYCWYHNRKSRKTIPIKYKECPDSVVDSNFPAKKGVRKFMFTQETNHGLDGRIYTWDREQLQTLMWSETGGFLISHFYMEPLQVTELGGLTCACPNGTPKDYPICQTQDEQLCSYCDDGYVLSGDECIAATTSTFDLWNNKAGTHSGYRLMSSHEIAARYSEIGYYYESNQGFIQSRNEAMGLTNCGFCTSSHDHLFFTLFGSPPEADIVAETGTYSTNTYDCNVGQNAVCDRTNVCMLTQAEWETIIYTNPHNGQCATTTQYGIWILDSIIEITP